jgi:hypothetical protein
MNERSSKHQDPSSRETPSLKLQSLGAVFFVFDPWSFSGAWSLEFGAFDK